MNYDEYFQRQLRLAEIGPAGQAKLRAANVLAVGAGALGHPLLSYLAAAGVGRLGVCDFDGIELSNLHRQPLFSPEDVGKQKTAVLAGELRRRHPASYYVEFPQGLTADNAALVLGADWDLVVDCTDRFSSRFLVHDLCAEFGIDLVTPSVGTFAGQLRFFPFSDPNRRGGCLRCLYPDTPEDGCTGSCAEDGILGAAAGLLGTAAALVALQRILGIAGFEASSDYQVDMKRFEISAFAISKNSSCQICSPAATASATASATAPQAKPQAKPQPEPAAFVAASNPSSGGTSALRIIDVREAHEVMDIDRILIPDAELVPMGQIPEWLSGVSKDTRILFICERGRRSRMMLDYAKEQGFEGLSLDGGYLGLRAQLSS